jgi:hypothetical protein
MKHHFNFQFLIFNFQLKICFHLIVITIFLACAAISPAQEQEPLYRGAEYRVKAAFVYNFIKFTQWPRTAFQDEESPIILCIASGDLFDGIISSIGLTIGGCEKSQDFLKLQGKTVSGRKLKITGSDESKKIEDCHVLFLCSTDKAFIAKTLDAVKDKNILTIGEIEEYTQMGGIITFFKEKNKIRFKVNRCAAKRAGLKLRSQLLMSAVKEPCEE